MNTPPTQTDRGEMDAEQSRLTWVVVRCQLGERDAFDELVDLCHVSAWRYVSSMLNDSNAQDAAQDAWLRVLRGLPKLRDPAAFRPWFFRVVRGAVMDRLRHKYAAPAIDTDGPELHALTSDEPDVLDRMSLNESRIETRAAVATLPELQREILTLFYFEGLRIEEITEVLAVSPGTVKSRLHRARAMLSDQLKKKETS